MRKLKVSEFNKLYYQGKAKYMTLMLDKKPVLPNDVHFFTSPKDMTMLVSFLKRTGDYEYSLRAKDFVSILVDKLTGQIFGVEKNDNLVEIQLFNVERSFEIPGQFK